MLGIPTATGANFENFGIFGEALQEGFKKLPLVFMIGFGLGVMLASGFISGKIFVAVLLVNFDGLCVFDTHNICRMALLYGVLYHSICGIRQFLSGEGFYRIRGYLRRLAMTRRKLMAVVMSPRAAAA